MRVAQVLEKIRFHFRKNPITTEFRQIAHKDSPSILAVWNRGLGDIPLGLYAFIEKAKKELKTPSFTFLTRSDLEEGMRMLGNVEVITTPHLERGVVKPLDTILEHAGLNRKAFDLCFETIDPTRHLTWQLGSLIPKLSPKSPQSPIVLPAGFTYIAMHVCSETQRFYHYTKDWPATHWKELINRLAEENEKYRFLLIGIDKQHDFSHPSVIDLRGQTSLSQLTDLLERQVSLLIAPDSGILSCVYYIDRFFPLTIVSLWSDPKQGILRQNVPSPNPLLSHIPVIAEGGDLPALSVEKLFEIVQKELENIIASDGRE